MRSLKIKNVRLAMVIKDKLSRPLEYLRISLTDRCNYRCSYCMPKDVFNSNYHYLKRDELLSFEEIIFFVKSLSKFNINKIRLTGGEPLLRRNIEVLINKLKTEAMIPEIALTTNGSLLTQKTAETLKKNGLDSVTISLDALDSSINNLINPLSNIKKVVEAIYIATDVFETVKINVVVMRNINTKEIISIVDKFKNFNVEIRFIEFMDVGETNSWNLDKVFSSKKVLDLISTKYKIVKLNKEEKSTADKWKLTNFNAKIGTISSISDPFCGSCNRARLSANGIFYTCLFASQGFNLLETIRTTSNLDLLSQNIQNIWVNRIDQYSYLRKIGKRDSITDSKIEMSYIGG